MKYLSQLLKTGKSIWTINDVHLFWGQTDKQYTRLILHRMKQAGVLISPTPGIYCLPNYNQREFASKLAPGSYISCSSVLVQHGILFQSHDRTVTLIRNRSEEKTIGDITYRRHKITDTIRSNPLGIENHKNLYLIASPERALCDLIYLTRTMHVDNPRPIQIQKLLRIAQIYTKTTQKRIYHFAQNAGYKQTQDSHVQSH